MKKFSIINEAGSLLFNVETNCNSALRVALNSIEDLGHRYFEPSNRIISSSGVEEILRRVDIALRLSDIESKITVKAL